MSGDFHHDDGPLGQRATAVMAATSLQESDHGLANDATSHTSSGRIRWAILASSCLVLFGNYYAFDNPASLNQPLQEYMQMSDDTYAYFLNILYTSYSLPNIVLPSLGGYASDKFGHRRLLLALSAMVAFGHLVVCLGVEKRHVPAMILGRVLFGAGETLAVTQSAITVKYFRGKELAMALGINICIARLGSVLNDVLTPYIWARTSVPTAFWGGFASCILSFMTACILVSLDRRYESTVTSGFTRLPTHFSDTRPSVETFRPSTSYDSPALSKTGRPSSSEEFGLEELQDGRGSLGVNARIAARERKRFINDQPDDSDVESSTNKQGRAPRQSAEDETDNQDHGDNRSDLVPLAQMNEADNVSPFRQCAAILYTVLDYSQSFWVLFVTAFLLIGVQVPFNSIHAGFLQMRWYHNDPQKAAQIMTVPDLLSSILVLPVGYFVDHYGQKSWLFMLCGLIIGFSHFTLGLIPISTPVPALMALGVASAIGAIITSAIPNLVKSHQIASAYGISVSAINLAFTVFPLLVAKLMTIDPSVYTYVEIFFSCCGLGGFFLAVRLRCLDTHGDLDRREIENNYTFVPH
ncbi:hypothetical protein BGZ65_008498 [Modicella reniformis]|uniref:Lysosomal dipeptide transporter MFSD1 n=1 Tax=Modicella reniformis TaxID=1440133 RepID=A0A9P6ML92_9FUNG|nr:hypothetical protein BGZ65_008498 [Modicella reniformis]